jgi:putative membrane protein
MILGQSNRVISLFAAAALLAGSAATAQQGGMQLPPGQQGAPGATPGTMNMPEAQQQNEPSVFDQSFMRDTLEDNDAQVEMSQLAAQKSPSEDVKQFSETMVKIHAELGDQLKPIAKQLGVGEPKGPSKKEKQEIAQLETLSGPEFDTAYLQDMAQEQQRSLKQFKSEEQSAQNPTVKKAATVDTPVLSQHFDAFQKLAQAHNVPLKSGK